MVEGRYPSDDIFRGDFDPEIRKKKSAAAKAIERKAATSKQTSKSQLRRGLSLLAGKTEELPHRLLGGTKSEVSQTSVDPEAEANFRVAEDSSDEATSSPTRAIKASQRTPRIFGRAGDDSSPVAQDAGEEASEPSSSPISAPFARSLFSEPSVREPEADETAYPEGAFFEDEEPAYVDRKHRFFSRSRIEPAPDEPWGEESSPPDIDVPTAQPWAESLSGGVKRFFSRVTHPESPSDADDYSPEPEAASTATDPESSPDTDAVWSTGSFGHDDAVDVVPSPPDIDVPTAQPWAESLSGGVKRFFSRVTHPETLSDVREHDDAGASPWVDPGLAQTDAAIAETRGPVDATLGHDQVGMPTASAAPAVWPVILEKAKNFFFQVEEVELPTRKPSGAPTEHGQPLGRLAAGLGGFRASVTRLGQPSSLGTERVVPDADDSLVAEKSDPAQPSHAELTSAGSVGASGQEANSASTGLPLRRPAGRHFAAEGSTWEPPQWNLQAQERIDPPLAKPSSASAGDLRHRPRQRVAERHIRPSAPERLAASASVPYTPRRVRPRGQTGGDGTTSGGLPSGDRAGRETVALIISVCLILAIVLGIGNLRNAGGLAAGKTSAADLAPSTTVVPQPSTTTAPSTTVTTAPPTTIVVTTTTQPAIAAGANPANAQVTVRVANGTSVAGAAGRITKKLQSLDFNVVVPINATVSNLTTTTVYYYSGFQVAGQAVAELLGLPASAAKPFTAAAPLPNIYPSDVNVVLGTDVAG